MAPLSAFRTGCRSLAASTVLPLALWQNRCFLRVGWLCTLLILNGLACVCLAEKAPGTHLDGLHYRSSPSQQERNGTTPINCGDLLPGQYPLRLAFALAKLCQT